MLYQVTNTSKVHAKGIMTRALPILKAHGAPIDASTCVISEAFVVGPDGHELPEYNGITFGFPAFDKLREQDLQAIANELAIALEMPCYTLDAAVKAGFPPR